MYGEKQMSFSRTERAYCDLFFIHFTYNGLFALSVDLKEKGASAITEGLKCET